MILLLLLLLLLPLLPRAHLARLGPVTALLQRREPERFKAG